VQTRSQALVHALLASLLPPADAPIHDADVLDELGVDAAVLVSIAGELEELEPDSGDFPIVPLAFAETVGDLVELVESWSQRDETAGPIDDLGLRSRVRIRRWPGA
jgi:hypothetical protein